MFLQNVTLRKKCPYSELFWSTFSRIQTEYGEMLRISLYSVQMRENADRHNSEYGKFLRSVTQLRSLIFHDSLVGKTYCFSELFLLLFTTFMIRLMG